MIPTLYIIFINAVTFISVFNRLSLGTQNACQFVNKVFKLA